MRILIYGAGVIGSLCGIRLHGTSAHIAAVLQRLMLATRHGKRGRA